MHTAIPSSASSKKAPWNKGHLIGQKRPLKPKDVWAIRVRLQLETTRRKAEAVIKARLEAAEARRPKPGSLEYQALHPDWKPSEE